MAKNGYLGHEEKLLTGHDTVGSFFYLQILCATILDGIERTTDVKIIFKNFNCYDYTFLHWFFTTNVRKAHYFRCGMDSTK